jgi:serine/threonine protein kinase
VHKEALLARGFSEEECDGKDYRWMQLQLSSLGIKGFAVGMDDAGFKLEDTKQLNKNNIEALSKFLANVPERAMPKEVFEKVRNTLDLAHEHNVFHRDLHERNLFLHLNEARELIDVSIIDWGESKILSEISGLKESEKKQLVYGDRTGAHLDDDYILKYEKLLISDEELAQKEKEEFMTEISQSLQIIKERAANPDELKTNPKLKAYEKLIEEIEYLTENEAEDKDFIENLDRELGNFSSLMISDPAADLQQFRLKLALWLDVIKGEHGAAVDENKVAEYLEQNKSSKLYIEKDKESFVKYLKEKAEQ